MTSAQSQPITIGTAKWLAELSPALASRVFFQCLAAGKNDEAQLFLDADLFLASPDQRQNPAMPEAWSPLFRMTFSSSEKRNGWADLLAKAIAQIAESDAKANRPRIDAWSNNILLSSMVDEAIECDEPDGLTAIAKVLPPGGIDGAMPGIASVVRAGASRNNACAAFCVAAIRGGYYDTRSVADSAGQLLSMAGELTVVCASATVGMAHPALNNIRKSLAAFFDLSKMLFMSKTTAKAALVDALSGSEYKSADAIVIAHAISPFDAELLARGVEILCVNKSNRSMAKEITKLLNLDGEDVISVLNRGNDNRPGHVSSFALLRRRLENNDFAAVQTLVDAGLDYLGEDNLARNLLHHMARHCSPEEIARFAQEHDVTTLFRAETSPAQYALKSNFKTAGVLAAMESSAAIAGVTAQGRVARRTP